MNRFCRIGLGRLGAACGVLAMAVGARGGVALIEPQIPPLTRSDSVGIVTNMKASLMVRERVPFGEDSFADLVLWKLPQALPGSTHGYKYRLAYVQRGECVLRYDNEAGKGDHRHVRTKQSAYRFESPEKLIQDFLRDVRRINRENSGS